ncbi:hypothetical protein BP5796_01738 [Coleophoma crateriformis]|uniref:Uncharacterized protein n=1 Tax=Coleophoma crateriformis TaxID=565419 RepID=A0A3D8T1D7_9HELO|nr:hypothetical protein BP5796_01738 [Coleophoma crateriformis]
MTNVLITGANRGIGKGLLSAYLSRADHTIIAGLRDPQSESSKALQTLPHGKGSKVILVKLDSSSETDALSAIKTIEREHHITQLDIVIANAGISNYFGPAAATPSEQMFAHFRVNTVAPLLLFQACASLLRAAGPDAKFVVISSGAGSLSGVEKLKVENTAYGASKAAVNFVTRRIHAENPDLIAFPINPGWLQTDLGNHAASGAGFKSAPMTVEDGVNGIIGIIDSATREDTSGKFMSSDGSQLDW